MNEQDILDIENKNLKLEQIINIYDRWLYMEQNGRTVENYLCKNQYYKIGIYGYGMIGRHLFFNLLNSRIEVDYIIDKNAKNIFLLNNKSVYTIDDILPNVNAIIITLGELDDAEKVKQQLEYKGFDIVVFFQDILKMM